MGLSSSYGGSSTLRSFLYNSSSPTAQTTAPETPASDEDSAMETMVVIEGFLTKQGQRFKTWKRRWCVVLADPPASRSGTPNAERDDLHEDGRQPLGRKAKLYYAKQPQSRSSRGEVTLDHFSVLDISTGSLDEEAMALQPSDLMPTSHCFCVNTQKRVYYFCCDTADDLARWQRALQSLMPHNQNRSDDDIQQRQPRLEREVRQLFQDLREVMRDHDLDGETQHHDNGDDGNGSHVNGEYDSDLEEADYVAKGKEATRDGSFSPGGKTKKKGNRKEEKRREKEREWLRVIEAEVLQAETIEDEDERREEWVRLKQALTKGMERALLHSDRRRAELTLRAAAAKASSMMADGGGDGSTSDESEGEAAKKQKNEEGKDQKNENDGAAAKERKSESGAAGRRREGTRRAGGRDEDDQDDGWNSDGFDTSREATMAREIMGKRGDDSGHRDDGDFYGDDSDGGLDGQGSDDTEDEEDGLLESDKRKRKRKSRRGRKKAPTRRIYSYGQEENIGFEGEPETERSFAGGSSTYGTDGAQGKNGHQRDFDPTTRSSFSFWSCFCC